jgi:hypothetical protein
LAQLRGDTGPRLHRRTPRPAQHQTQAPREPTEDELKKAVMELLAGVSTTMLEQVPSMVRSTLLEMTRTVEIKVGKQPTVKVENSPTRYCPT